MPSNKTTDTTSNPSKGHFAIVEASGKQFWLEPNRYYDLDRIKADINETISIDKVLLLGNGKETTIGKPYVTGATVQLKVLEHRRGTKIIVYKMRPKKKTRRKNGHRQELTRVMVESISFGKEKKTTKTKSVASKGQESSKVSSSSSKSSKETSPKS